jgi:hypothetical protein
VSALPILSTVLLRVEGLVQYYVELNAVQVGAFCAVCRRTLDEAMAVGDAWYGPLKWYEIGGWFKWWFGRRWKGYDEDGKCIAIIHEQDVEWTGPYYE